MRFALTVHGGPATFQASRSALNFARAALAEGHTITRVFFHAEGVHNGSALTVPPQDESDPAALWAELGREHGTELVVCVASALRRGVLDADEARRHRREHGNLRGEFTIGGLGLLVDAALEADRLVTFGV
jgi:tRNA 2-thiouridine synthesizing protein D